MQLNSFSVPYELDFETSVYESLTAKGALIRKELEDISDVLTELF